MPPDVEPIKPPTDRGFDAIPFLEHYGIFARTQPIRSRDKSALSDPFGYYLRRRLGLADPLSYSKALTRGSWAHTLMELMATRPVEAWEPLFRERLNARLDELKGVCDECGLHAERRAAILAREQQTALEVLGWMSGLAQWRLYGHPALADGFIGHLRSYRTIAVELRLAAKVEGVKTKCMAEIDRLMLDESKGTLWIADYKTCAGSPAARAQQCSVEFQIRHYLYLLNTNLDHIIKRFNLPATTTFGGFKHLILKSPSISLGSQDRPYHYSSIGKRTGVSGTAYEASVGVWGANTDNGLSGSFTNEEEAAAWLHEQTGKKPEKIFDGEPDPNRYKRRCIDYYNATGDHQDKSAERATDPPVVISTTKVDEIWDYDTKTEYLDTLKRIDYFATVRAIPRNFPRFAEGMTKMHSPDLNAFAPFYVSPVSKWPQIAHENRLIPTFIDEDVPDLEDGQCFIGDPHV